MGIRQYKKPEATRSDKYKKLVESRAKKQQSKSRKKRSQTKADIHSEWGDRGTVGQKEAMKKYIAADNKRLAEMAKIDSNKKEDLDLLKVHGKDAPRSKSFLTPSRKKKGGRIKGKPVNGITRAGKPVNGIKGTKVAKADWMKGLTADQIKQILGAPTADPSGVVRHSKKKTKKPTKVRKAKGGGMTGEGLYPAEEARSGTMSQARRKKYMKKGGKITYRMTGGQVVDAGYD